MSPAILKKEYGHPKVVTKFIFVFNLRETFIPNVELTDVGKLTSTQSGGK